MVEVDRRAEGVLQAPGKQEQGALRVAEAVHSDPLTFQLTSIKFKDYFISLQINCVHLIDLYSYVL